MAFVPGTRSRTIALARRLVEGLTVGPEVQLGASVRIGLGSALWAPKQLIVEDAVSIGRWCTIMANGRIGRGTMIANSVGIIGRRDHDVSALGLPVRYSPWVGEPGNESQSGSVDIGEDVWIGYGAILLSDVTIGRGAIIGAGAVVTSAIEPYAIAVGNPARPVGARFNTEQILKHETALNQFWSEWKAKSIQPNQ